MRKLVSAEKGKGLVWGVAPFPQGLEPLLADVGIDSPTYGILFRSKKFPSLYAKGQALVIYSVSADVAEELLEEYQNQQ